MRARLHCLPLPEFGMLFVLIVAIAGLRALAGPGPVVFNTLGDFREFAERWGLYCELGEAESSCGPDNFFITDHRVAARSLPWTKGNCGVDEAWQGIIWITQIT